MSRRKKRVSENLAATQLRGKMSGKYLVEYGLFALNPGSPAAKAIGCICVQHDGSEMFACNRDCPVHDLTRLIATLDERSESVEIL
jgi:hypothetical protein